MKIKERKNFQEKDNNFYTAYTKNGRRLFDVVAHEEKIRTRRIFTQSFMFSYK